MKYKENLRTKYEDQKEIEVASLSSSVSVTSLMILANDAWLLAYISGDSIIENIGIY